MKNLIAPLVISLMLILSGCSIERYELSGDYSNEPTIITSTKSFDSVWSNVIDLFATKGLSIKIIDKSSGIIVSEKSSFLDHYTFEYKGKLEYPKKWIVLESIYVMGNQWEPDKLTAEWNVRIKSIPSGGCTVNVNLTNIEATKHFDASKYSAASNYDIKGYSTGVFENKIASIVK